MLCRVYSLTILAGLLVAPLPTSTHAAETLWQEESRIVIQYEDGVKRRMTVGLSTPVTIDCPANYTAISGGYRILKAKGPGNSDLSGSIQLVESIPNPRQGDLPHQWKFQVKNIGSEVVELEMSLRVVCMRGAGR